MIFKLNPTKVKLDTFLLNPMTAVEHRVLFGSNLVDWCNANGIPNTFVHSHHSGECELVFPSDAACVTFHLTCPIADIDSITVAMVKEDQVRRLRESINKLKRFSKHSP